jgi:hypothetical protein
LAACEPLCCVVSVMGTPIEAGGERYGHGFPHRHGRKVIARLGRL